MKKLKYLAMTLCVALCAGFTACGDDDKDENDPIPVPVDRIPANGVYTTKNGNKVVVSDIDGTGFTYNTDGLCTQLGSMNIFYSGGLIINGDTQAKFKMNEMGYITEIDATYSWKGSDYSGSSCRESEENTYRFSYNGNGYLVKMNTESNFLHMDLTTGVDSYEKSTRETTFTWDGTRLSKVSLVENGEADGEKYRLTRDYVIQGGGVMNTLGQHTIAYENLLDFEFDDFSQVGLFGKAPSEFVQSVARTQIYISEEKGEDQNLSWVETYEYEFNSNGTIRTETEKDNNTRVWAYSYDFLGNPLLTAPAKSYVKAKPAIRRHDSWREARRARLGRQ